MRKNVSLLPTAKEIISTAEPKELFPSCGVYFLIKGKQVVYVGQSTNVYSRVSNYSDYDEVAFVWCAKEALNAVEAYYIHLLQPPNNGWIWAGGPKTKEQLMAEGVEPKEKYAPIRMKDVPTALAELGITKGHYKWEN